MENKMLMPANYCVMTEEEMTYTSGGDEYDAAVAFVGGVYLFSFALGVAAVADYIWGVAVSRNWIAENKKDENNNNRSVGELFNKGMNDLSQYMGKSFGNAFVGGFTALNLALSVETWPITAIAWLTA